MHSYERYTEEKVQRRRQCDHVRMQWSDVAQGKESRATRSKEGREGFFPRALRGSRDLISEL